jgi:anti-sigma B factor antagonist
MSATHGGHWLEREDVGEVTLVRVKLARLGDDDTQDLFNQIYSLVDEMGRSRLVVNLREVDYLPSLALGKLLMLNRKTQAAEGRLALCRLTPSVDEIFQVTHLQDLIAVYQSEEEALESFHGASPGPPSDGGDGS